ncbi:MAG: type II toxin-antitoxin system prevent-host-death family antitoxin [Acidimicrobiia bacterium]
MALEEVGVRQLRQQASAYLRRVAEGESFVVTDYGKPVAVLASTMEAVRARSEEVVQRLVDAGEYPSVDAALAEDAARLAERARHRIIGDAPRRYDSAPTTACQPTAHCHSTTRPSPAVAC